MTTGPGCQEATMMTSTPVIGRFRQAIERATIPACDVWTDGAGEVVRGGRWPAPLAADMEAGA